MKKVLRNIKNVEKEFIFAKNINLSLDNLKF